MSIMIVRMAVWSGPMVNELTLDEIGTLEGTDKSSLLADYLRHYEREFSYLRDEPINVIEIGVQGGSSLRMWERFFTRATLIGIDIDPSCKNQQRGRMIVEIGSQDDRDFLDRVCAAYPPTIVIDDGSHRADHIATTFDCVFPNLLPSGCYVIEDLHFQLSRNSGTWRGNADVLTPDYLVAHVRTLLAAEFREVGRTPSSADIWDKVDRINFIPRAAMIWKKSDGGSLLDVITQMEILVERSGRASNYSLLASFIQSHAGPLDRAEAAAQRAVDLFDRAWGHHFRLAGILELKGDIERALLAIQRSYDLAPEGAPRDNMRPHIERIKRKLSTSA
jgi:hypothetical protein